MNLPDFSSFFLALWNYEAFPWQVRLADSLDEGEWPSWVTLPTGMGKTSVIDIAIYALAKQAHLPANERKAPVRIVFAVNRRLVVDEAFSRARSIASKLAVACGQRTHEEIDEDDWIDASRVGVLEPIALALKALAGGDDAPSLEAYPLRGATYTDHAWTRSVTQPLVVTTTLDQLGSRLLFRGYGCSIGARPLHAALLTHDALLLLDEAHTSKAFSETLQAIGEWRCEARESLVLPFASVQLTATPPKEAGKPFELLEEEKSHPIIGNRLTATKPTSLHAIAGAKAKERHKKIAAECQTQIKDFCDPGKNPHVRRILIVVNRVATARQIRDTLKSDRTHGCEVELLTGGLRPLDRDALVERLVNVHQLQTTKPAPDVPKLILVSTQCVEVGADLDFDALITELAPLDNLRQRFGRLNRYGRPVTTPAAILAPEEALETADSKKADPMYGLCLPAVWNWLKQHEAGLDFGLAAYDFIKPTPDELPALLAPAPSAPVLLPAHLDLLCQTSPSPHHEPEPSLYIHGPQQDFPVVGVVLRAGLYDTTGKCLTIHAEQIIEALPPLATEAATVQLGHARRWLLGDKGSTDCDVPSIVEDNKDDESKAVLPPVLRYANGEVTALKTAAHLRPGDVLIVPIETPDISLLIPGLPTDPSRFDQLEEAHLLARDKILLCLTETRMQALRGGLDSILQEQWDALFFPLREAEAALKTEGALQPFCKKEWMALLPQLVDLLSGALPDGIWRKWAAKAVRLGWWIEQHPAEGIIARNRSRVGFTPWPLESDEIGRQGNSGEAVTLAAHQEGVESRVVAMCANLNLPPGILSALVHAARYHDVGKTDPRFQAWLHGSTVWAAAAKVDLAKSQYPPQLRKRYQVLAGTPDGFRHELLSTLVVADSVLAFNHPERDLLLHLIASHHGYCRASAPVVLDDEPESFTFTIDGETIGYSGRTAPLANFADGVPERFWKLTRRFGWWGLAFLETLLRIADQRESAQSGNPTD